MGKVYEMEKYIEPEMEIIEFDVEDIITTSDVISNPGGGSDWDIGGGFGWEEEGEEPW